MRNINYTLLDSPEGLYVQGACPSSQIPPYPEKESTLTIFHLLLCCSLSIYWMSLIFKCLIGFWTTSTKNLDPGPGRPGGPGGPAGPFSPGGPLGPSGPWVPVVPTDPHSPYRDKKKGNIIILTVFISYSKENTNFYTQSTLPLVQVCQETLGHPMKGIKSDLSVFVITIVFILPYIKYSLLGKFRNHVPFTKLQSTEHAIHTCHSRLSPCVAASTQCLMCYWKPIYRCNRTFCPFSPGIPKAPSFPAAPCSDKKNEISDNTRKNTQKIPLNWSNVIFGETGHIKSTKGQL